MNFGVSFSPEERRQLEVLDRGEKLPVSHPCPVQVWQLGEGLTLVARGVRSWLITPAGSGEN